MLLNREIKLFNLFSFFSSLNFYLPIKIIYFHQVTGSYSIASAIISFVWISQALLELPTGIFSDLVGRRKTLIFGSVCSIAAYFIYAAGSIFWIFILGSFIEGAARAFFSGNNNAYLHNILTTQGKEDTYQLYYSKLNTYISTAVFTAALVSGFLLTWSISFFMWVNLIPQFIAFIISLFLIEISIVKNEDTNIYNHLKDAIMEIKKNLNLKYMSLSEILSGGGIAAYEFQAAVFALVWPAWAVGIARAIQEGGVIPSFWYASKINDKLGAKKVLTISWITSMLGNILAATSKSYLSPLFIILSLPLYGASDSAYQNLLQIEFSEKQRATIASLNSLGNSISFAIVLYICGVIANLYNPFIALLATQFFLIPSYYYKFKFLRRMK